MSMRNILNILNEGTEPSKTPRDAIIAALIKVHGHDPLYDDGPDADVILQYLNNAGYQVVRNTTLKESNQATSKLNKAIESIDDNKPLIGALDPKKLAEMLPEVTDVPKFATAVQKIKRGDAEKLTLAEKGQLALAFVALLKGDKDEKMKFIRRLMNVKAKE